MLAKTCASLSVLDGRTRVAENYTGLISNQHYVVDATMITGWETALQYDETEGLAKSILIYRTGQNSLIKLNI